MEGLPQVIFKKCSILQDRLHTRRSESSYDWKYWNKEARGKEFFMFLNEVDAKVDAKNFLRQTHKQISKLGGSEV